MHLFVFLGDFHAKRLGSTKIRQYPGPFFGLTAARCTYAFGVAELLP